MRGGFTSGRRAPQAATVVVAIVVVAQLAASATALAVRLTSSADRVHRVGLGLERGEPAGGTTPAPSSSPSPRQGDVATAAPASPPTPQAPPTNPPPNAPPAPTPAARLQARLDAALSGTSACMVLQEGNQSLYSRSPDLALAPASTQKLLVAAAALSRLGPDFRFETKVVAPAAPVNGAVSDLWLVGSGDPLLATPEYAATLQQSSRTRGTPVTPLATLADALAAQGVKAVPGGIHGDDSRYETLRYLPTWTQEEIAEADVGPLGALTVNGGLEAWQGKEILAADPATLAASQLARLLTQRGTPAGPAGDGPAPARGVVLARIQSAPLAQVVAAMLTASDNLAAELLVRELDRQAGGTGSTAGGTGVVVAEARRLGVPTAGVQLQDGSGLSPGDRVTCPALLGAVTLSSSPRLSAIAAGLPVAGATGTLAHRYAGTPAAGRLAAKTGWIRGAAGMAGTLDASSHHLRFAFLVNGPPDWPTARAIEDRVVGALVTYPEGG